MAARLRRAAMPNHFGGLCEAAQVGGSPACLSRKTKKGRSWKRAALIIVCSQSRKICLTAVSANQQILCRHGQFPARKKLSGCR